jgi:predicted dehydrogenase
MNRPLRCGLIGAGGIGKNHLKNLLLLQEEGLVQLTCIADPFVEKLAEVKAELESKGVRWYTDFQKLVTEEAELDSISIATPIHLHARMAAAALARGLFIYLEKPPVPLIQQLNDLMKLDHRRKVAVGFQHISSVQIRGLKEKMIAGALGDIKTISAVVAWPRLGKYYNRASWAGKMMLQGEPVFDGPATNALAHILNDIMFLAGKEMDSFEVPIEIEAEYYRARPIESYDVACLRGKFQSGVTFCFACTHASETPRPFGIVVTGSKGSAWTSDDNKAMGSDCGLELPQPPYPDSFYRSYHNFVSFASGNSPRPANRLEDTRAFICATNAGLISSGGIHGIQQQYVRKFGSGETEGYDVPGIIDLLERSGKEGKLFSELGAPWSRKTQVISLRGLSSIQLQDYMIH